MTMPKQLWWLGCGMNSADLLRLLLLLLLLQSQVVIVCHTGLL